jgi:Hydroxymethylglutaryl-coenzyme A synthase N terminal
MLTLASSRSARATWRLARTEAAAARGLAGLAGRPQGVGILAAEFYTPTRVVRQADLEAFDGVSQGKYTVGLGQESMSFTDDLEDPVSMVLNAVDRLLTRYKIDPKSIGRLEVRARPTPQPSTPPPSQRAPLAPHPPPTPTPVPHPHPRTHSAPCRRVARGGWRARAGRSLLLGIRAGGHRDARGQVQVGQDGRHGAAGRQHGRRRCVGGHSAGVRHVSAVVARPRPLLRPRARCAVEKVVGSCDCGVQA